MNDEINTKKLIIVKSLKEHYIHSKDNGTRIIQLIDEIEDKARASERKQVFEGLDKIIRGQGATEITVYNQRQIFFNLKDYQALKKKCKVD